MLLEKYLIEHCAPTLASLKTASLFYLPESAEPDLEQQVNTLDGFLREKGLFLQILSRREGKALVYLCRQSHLQRDLQRAGVARFLAGYGYEHIDVDYALERLGLRLQESAAFPHEIGIFLGYPLGDVTGFIQNAGKNSKCAGCWKVYCNECETMKLFARIRKCRELYAWLWHRGRTIWQLTVAA